MTPKETRTPWMELDSRINDLENLVKTFGALCSYIYDHEQELAVILLSPLDELDHIQRDLRRAFDEYHDENRHQGKEP